MELRAALEALRALTEPCVVEFYTDSQYLRLGITEWLSLWKRRNWRTIEKKPVKNADLWRQLDSVSATHRVTWHWLKGHAGHAGNERCDLLAGQEIGKIRKQFTRDQLRSLVSQFRSSQASQG